MIGDRVSLCLIFYPHTGDLRYECAALPVVSVYSRVVEICDKVHFQMCAYSNPEMRVNHLLHRKFWRIILIKTGHC
jgi:hypothetical protein